MLETRTGLIEVALGRSAPDLIIQNIRLVNVYTGEILSGQEVSVRGGRIAYVGPPGPQPGPQTEVVDGKGLYLVPGFFDVHGHADFITDPLALARQILPTGTTGMLTDTHDICGALGVKGLDLALEVTADIPFRYYFAAPVSSPPLPGFEGEDIFSLEAVQAALSKPRVLAVSEVTSWSRLLEPEPDFLNRMVYAAESGKRIEGHLAGCPYPKMNALIACGVTSCHESITAEEALQRLRLGLYVILRNGSIRSDLEELAKLITDNPDLDCSKVMLSPDWLSPKDVLEYGYMNYLVARAVELGIPAIKAIQMVTVNPAVYLGLNRDIGGIAPGRLADMLLVEDLSKPLPVRVWVGGQTVAAEGKLLAEIGEFPATKLSAWRPERIPNLPVEAGDFRVKSEAGEYAAIPCIHMVSKNITKQKDIELPVRNNQVEIGEYPELLKISQWSADKKGWATGILSGFGARIGGLASSMANDTHFPMVVGSDAEDMALAVNRMMSLNGGIVLVEKGQVLFEFPLAVGGVLANRNLAELAKGWSEINSYLQDAGCPWDDPLFGFGFLCFTGLPHVRITPSGVLDIRKKEIIFGN